MLELKDEEDTEPPMSMDMIRLMDFLCKHRLGIGFFHENTFCILENNGMPILRDLPFTDLYYPKNLLRTLKENL